VEVTDMASASNADEMVDESQGAWVQVSSGRRRPNASPASSRPTATKAEAAAPSASAEEEVETTTASEGVTATSANAAPSSFAEAATKPPKEPSEQWTPWGGGADVAVERVVAAVTAAKTESAAASERSSNVGAEEEAEAMAAEEEGAAWRSFAERQPSLMALDVHVRHLLGEDLDELSMAQVTELLEVQRGLVAKLEEARLSLARRQERELTEERMIQRFEDLQRQQ